MQVPSHTTQSTSSRLFAGTTTSFTQKASTRADSNTSIVDAYERLDKNGTALSKLRMNHASVLDAGRRDTKGGSRFLAQKLILLRRFVFRRL
mmetsp:Transcript_9907/g.18871  ORF Transcript_9907/g.18871 Transcript_9907/m.18871 type:complete len:92 (-) Transcript_9907:631-906(-)